MIYFSVHVKLHSVFLLLIMLCLANYLIQVSTRNVNTDGLVIGRVIHMVFVWNGACVLSLRGDLHKKTVVNRY